MDTDFLLKWLDQTFNLWRLKFGVYNWTARHADSDLGCKRRTSTWTSRDWGNKLLPIIDKVLQSVLV